MSRRPIPRWLGSLFAPAEDPRRNAAADAGLPDTQALLMALQRSRAELAQLRSQIEVRATHNPLAAELADEERELLEAEHALLLSLDEGRARRALLAARLRAAEAQLRTDA